MDSKYIDIVLNEETLDENIPRDLAAAYRRANAEEVNNNIHSAVNLPVASRHYEIDPGKYYRRAVKWDYANSNYEVLTPEETINFLGLIQKADGNWKCNLSKMEFGNRIQQLRFIIDGYLAEWEARTQGSSIAPRYSTTIPSNKRTLANGEPMEPFSTKHGDSYNTEDVKQYKDLVTVIKISDKIYKTDEYEHPISTEKQTERTAKDNTEYLTKTFLSKDDSGYDAHKPYQMLGKKPQGDSEDINKNYQYSVGDLDTGAHLGANGSFDDDYLKSLTNKFTDSTGDEYWKKFGYGNANNRAEIRNFFSKYLGAIKEKYIAKTKFKNSLNYLNKIKKEKDTYDEEEYIELLQKAEENKKAKEKTYEEASLNYRKIADHFIRNMDIKTKSFKQKLNDLTVDLEAAFDRAFKCKEEIEQIKQRSISTKNSNYTNHTMHDMTSEIEKLLKDLQELRKQQSETQQELEGNQEQVLDVVENADIKDSEEINKLEDALGNLWQHRDGYLNDLFTNSKDKLAELYKTLDETEEEISKLQPVTAAKKELIKQRELAREKEKVLDPSLQNIVTFKQDF